MKKFLFLVFWGAVVYFAAGYIGLYETIPSVMAYLFDQVWFNELRVDLNIVDTAVYIVAGIQVLLALIVANFPILRKIPLVKWALLIGAMYLVFDAVIIINHVINTPVV